jgi:hypothetical protein
LAPSKKKCLENGENGAHRRRWASAILIRANLIGLESKGEMFEPGQREKASDHHFGRNVFGKRNEAKDKLDKVRGKQK